MDAWNTGRTFADLSQKFYSVEFIDLCTIIEQIVLREEIVLVGKYNLLPRNYVSALKPFVDAGVFKICIDAFQIEKDLATETELRMLAQQAKLAGLTNTSLKDADYAVTRLLGAEIALRIPAVPLLQHLQNYQFLRRSVLDNTVCDLTRRYADLSERVKKYKEPDFRRALLNPLPIPPIALQVLQRAHNFEKLREQILTTRDEFAPLRRRMTELATMMSDPDLDSTTYFSLLEAWEKQWRSLSDVAMPSLVHMGDTTNALLSHGREMASAYKNGASFGTVLAGLKLVDMVGTMARKATFRPVHLSVNNYVRTHPRHMIGAVSRVFGADPLRVKQQLEMVAGVPANVWHVAMRKLRAL